MDSTAKDKLKFAVNLLRGLGDEMKSRYWKPGVNTRDLRKRTPKLKGQGHQWDFDKFASNYICSRLEKETPAYGILDEERYFERPDDTSWQQAESIWVVDDVDASSNLADGGNKWGHWLAEVYRGEPIFALTYRPGANNGAGELIWSMKDEGAHLLLQDNEFNIHVNPSPIPTVVVSKQFKRKKALDDILAKLPSGTAVKRSSGAQKLIQVATGRVNLFICPPGSPMYLWDVCAPHLHVEESGGKVRNFYREEIMYNRSPALMDGVFASNGVVDRLLPEFKRP